MSDTPRYRVLHSLGKGGMGEVFLADDTQLGRQVAIKFLADGTANEGRALDRLSGSEATCSGSTLYGNRVGIEMAERQEIREDDEVWGLASSGEGTLWTLLTPSLVAEVRTNGPGIVWSAESVVPPREEKKVGVCQAERRTDDRVPWPVVDDECVDRTRR